MLGQFPKILSPGTPQDQTWSVGIRLLQFSQFQSHHHGDRCLVLRFETELHIPAELAISGHQGSLWFSGWPENGFYSNILPSRQG